MTTVISLDAWGSAVCDLADGILLSAAGWSRSLHVVSAAAASDPRALLQAAPGPGAAAGVCWPDACVRAPLDVLAVGALDDEAAADRLCHVLATLRSLPFQADLHVLLGPGERLTLCPVALRRLRDWRRADADGSSVLFTLASGVADAGVWPAADVRRATALLLAVLAGDPDWAERVRHAKRVADEPLWGTFAVALCRSQQQPGLDPPWLTALDVPLDGLGVVDGVSGVGSRGLAVPAHWPALRCAFAHGFPLESVAGLDRGAASVVGA